MVFGVTLRGYSGEIWPKLVTELTWSSPARTECAHYPTHSDPNNPYFYFHPKAYSCRCSSGRWTTTSKLKLVWSSLQWMTCTSLPPKTYTYATSSLVRANWYGDLKRDQCTIVAQKMDLKKLSAGLMLTCSRSIRRRLQYYFWKFHETKSEVKLYARFRFHQSLIKMYLKFPWHNFNLFYSANNTLYIW